MDFVQEKVDADFSNKIILCDEAHFHYYDFANRQTWLLFGRDFCCRHHRAVLEIYVITITVNGIRFHDMIMFSVPK